MPEPPGPYRGPITPRTIVPKLLFALFGHQPNFSGLMAESTTRTELKEQLIDCLNDAYETILEGQFDGSSKSWIDEAYRREYFRTKGRRIAQFAPDLRLEEVDFVHAGAHKKRAVFAALAAVSADIFRFGNRADSSAFVQTWRDRLRVERAGQYDAQFAAFKQIEQTLRRVANPPQGGVSYDDKMQPVLKTEKAGSFLGFSERSRVKGAIIGDYITYRRAFMAITGQSSGEPKPFIREFLKVSDSMRGLVFRWDTIFGAAANLGHFSGVLYFTRGVVWLQGDCGEPFPRMRVMAASLTDWQAMTTDPNPSICCRGELLSVVSVSGGVFLPESRKVIIRRYDPENHGLYRDRLSYLSNQELENEGLASEFV